MTVNSTTPTKILITWTHSCPKADEYEVSWMRSTSGDCPDVESANATIVRGSTRHNIMGLEEDSHYTISVRANTATGNMYISESVTGMTGEAGERLLHVVSSQKSDLFFRFPAPSAPPTSVSPTKMTYSSITVQWGPVNCIHRNGEITGYLVQYEFQENGSTQTVNVSGDATNETTITELRAATNYSIKVAAVNSAGTGVYSDAMFVVTEGILFTIINPQRACTQRGLL